MAEDDFRARREAAKARLDRLTGARGGDAADRRRWFEAVYDTAGGDAAAVPWAELEPKAVLLDWLARNPGCGRRAVDVACGLGDNAEALAAAGYQTTAFDVATGAIDWAKRRFPESPVDYRVADLFALPADWVGRFDLVHECYTLQALAEPMRSAVFAAIASLVAPGGTLVVITRMRKDGDVVEGPPWPLTRSELARFEALGLSHASSEPYEVRRQDRIIPHLLAEYRRHD